MSNLHFRWAVIQYRPERRFHELYSVGVLVANEHEAAYRTIAGNADAVLRVANAAQYDTDFQFVEDYAKSVLDSKYETPWEYLKRSETHYMSSIQLHGPLGGIGKDADSFAQRLFEDFIL